MGLKSRNTGKRIERLVVSMARDAGIPAKRTWQTASGDDGNRECDVVIGGLSCQVKYRANDYSRVYAALENVDFAVLKSGRGEPLAVMPYRKFLALLGKANGLFPVRP